MGKRTNRQWAVQGCAAAAVFAAMGVAGSAQGATTVYSDIFPYQVDSVTSEGYAAAAGATGADIGGSHYSVLVGDDITPVTGYAGQTVTSLSFYLENTSKAAATFNVELRFYDTTGTDDSSATGAPGNLLYSFDTSAITLNADTDPGGDTDAHRILLQVNLPTTGSTFVLPSGTFWAGVAFDNAGISTTTRATADQMDNDIGVLLADANPTAGSSQYELYQADAGGTYTTSNPSGNILTGSNAGDPPGNFALSVTVPEPTTAGVLFGISGIGLARRRRRQA